MLNLISDIRYAYPSLFEIDEEMEMNSVMK